MKERKRHIAETDKLQRLVDKEYEKLEDQRDMDTCKCQSIWAERLATGDLSGSC
jgi:hypothetical protein